MTTVTLEDKSDDVFASGTLILHRYMIYWKHFVVAVGGQRVVWNARNQVSIKSETCNIFLSICRWVSFIVQTGPDLVFKWNTYFNLCEKGCLSKRKQLTCVETRVSQSVHPSVGHSLTPSSALVMSQMLWTLGIYTQGTAHGPHCPRPSHATGSAAGISKVQRG